MSDHDAFSDDPANDRRECLEAVLHFLLRLGHPETLQEELESLDMLQIMAMDCAELLVDATCTCARERDVEPVPGPQHWPLCPWYVEQLPDHLN